MSSLSLPHQVTLIQLHDTHGTSHVDSNWNTYLLAGAIIAELQLQDRLAVVRADCFALRAGPPLSGLLGEAEAKLGTGQRSMAKTLGALVGFWGIGELRERLIDELVSVGAIKRETDHFLFIPYRWRYPTDDPSVEQSLIQALRHYLDTVQADAPPTRPDLLLSLLRAAKLLEHVWTAEELPSRLPRIHERTRRAPIGKVVKQCVEDAEAAAAAAVVAASI